jgi:leucyl/phenylalanyl-tRNA--protein transferase
VSIFRLPVEPLFPDPALAEPEGLLAIGGDLSEAQLLAAYRNGIFPWYNPGDPILWWSPDPRMVLYPEELHLSRSLRRSLRRLSYVVTVDCAFSETIRACSRAPRLGQAGTWITPEMERAYVRLHRAGYAHSVECRRNGELVGGLYGVALGRCFFGESMFHHQPEASKIAFAALVPALLAAGYRLIDCQQRTQLLAGFGAREIPRAQFLHQLRQWAGDETGAIFPQGTLGHR